MEKSNALYSGASTLSADSDGDLILTGGDNGVAGIFSVSRNSIIQEVGVGSGAVTGAVWAGTRAVVSTSSGVVKVFEDGSEIASFSGHTGKITALAAHPSQDIVASVGVDQTYILYDLVSLTQATQVYTDSGKLQFAGDRPSIWTDSHVELTCACFHPDGGLFAAGATDGHIKVYTGATGNQEAILDGDAAIHAV